MCFSSKTTTNYVQTPTQSVSTQQKPAWVTAAGQGLYSQAAALGQQPYQAYQGPRIAGFNQDEQNAFSLARQNVGSYEPHLNQAQNLIGSATQQGNLANLSPYMNPYQQAVTDRNLQANVDQGIMARNQIGANAAQSGAFGGGRHGVVEAMQMRDEAQRASDISNQGNLANFMQAQNQFNTERNRQMQGAGALGQLAGQRQAYGQQDVSNLATLGGGIRDMQQANLDLAYSDFLTQREMPWQNLNRQLAVLQGTPYESQAMNTAMHNQTPQTTKRGSTFGNIVGGALTGLSAINTIGRMF